ncbi:hypothetical protein AOQ84DRAFT_225492 [Glonium stellatum]|uniref:Uncharacterized protein n=1 Tax=Glonium stellatum TaxID=574774 RepID=A0A8E2EU29_9PEZI|nr:hypothetical protein AOQ84DRAFT_225492 [Glonium stellatum]
MPNNAPSTSPFAISASPNPNATTTSHVPPNLALPPWSGNLRSQDTDLGRDNYSQLSPETTTTLPGSGTATIWQSSEPPDAAIAPVVCSDELQTMRDVRSFSMMEPTLVVKTEAPSLIQQSTVYNTSYADCETKLGGLYIDVQFSSAGSLLQENVGLREEIARLLQEITRLLQENARVQEKAGL